MSTFDNRRRLEKEDWLKIAGIAAGAGAGVAAVTAYFTRIWFQKVPLERRDVVETLDQRHRRVIRGVEAEEARISG